MATAPTPGVGKRTAVTKAAQKVLTVTVRGVSSTLAINDVPTKERMAVRKTTGLPLEAFLGEVTDGGANRIGLDSLIVLWWLARRANGEPDLSFDAADSEWPRDLDPADLDVTVDDPDVGDDSPEV